MTAHLFDNWFDPIESAVRERVRGLIEELIHGELDTVLVRPRYVSFPKIPSGLDSHRARRFTYQQGKSIQRTFLDPIC
jgi:hypothetical protein